MSKNKGSRFDEERRSGGTSFDPKQFLAKVGDGKTVAQYQDGQVVFAQGDAAEAVFYLQKGRVKITVVSEQGKEAVVGILDAGYFFGEGCLNGHPLRTTTATAIGECLITRIAKAAMIATMHNEPEFSQLFMAYLLSRNSRIEEDLIDQLFNSSEKRLARLLLLLANFGKDGGKQPVIGKFSQETLAEMIGTTRSRVSFFMNKFRKLGYIEYNGKLEVNNSLLNVVFVRQAGDRHEGPGRREEIASGARSSRREVVTYQLRRSRRAHPNNFRYRVTAFGLALQTRIQSIAAPALAAAHPASWSTSAPGQARTLAGLPAKNRFETYPANPIGKSLVCAESHPSEVSVSRRGT
jgi:CRP/FNR family cyclic AMP-dependent transcriptional regulator